MVGFRQTENAINVRPGNGVWKTVTGLGKVQRKYFDPVTGQAGLYGIVEEGTTQVIVTVRVRVENRKLTEAEWYLVATDGPGIERLSAAGRSGHQSLESRVPDCQPAAGSRGAEGQA